MSTGFVVQNDKVLWFRGASLQRILAWTVTDFELNELETEIIQSAFYGLDFAVTDETPDLIGKVRLTCESLLAQKAKMMNWPKVKEQLDPHCFLSFEKPVLDIDRKSAERVIRFLDNKEGIAPQAH